MLAEKILMDGSDTRIEGHSTPYADTVSSRDVN